MNIIKNRKQNTQKNIKDKMQIPIEQTSVENKTIMEDLKKQSICVSKPKVKTLVCPGDGLGINNKFEA